MKFAALNFWEIASHFVDLALAYLIALPIGWDREHKERSAGIRTFPLVAMASCGFVLIALRVLGEGSIGQARILEGLITGVGFIGGGADVAPYLPSFITGLCSRCGPSWTGLQTRWE